MKIPAEQYLTFYLYILYYETFQKNFKQFQGKGYRKPSWQNSLVIPEVFSFLVKVSS